MRIHCIYRESVYSPGNVDNDKAILDAVANLLIAEGNDVRMFLGDDLVKKTFVESVEMLEDADVILSMARSQEVLFALSELECHDVEVVNPTHAIELCACCGDVDSVLRENDIPVPPADGEDGVWLKKNDEFTMEKDDVVFCPTKEAEEAANRMMYKRGIEDVFRQAHVKGDLVKFYGVRGTGFFRTVYPNDLGRSKFGQEEANGPNHHYAFSHEALHECAEKAATAIGLDVYGGDAIVREDGSFVFIDFNDWPSFSPVREEAAQAIVEKLRN